MAEKCSSDNGEQCSPVKKLKLEAKDVPDSSKNIHETEVCLSNFEIKRILHNNSVRKQICVEGAFKGIEGSAVFVLEKQNFSDDETVLKKEIFSKDTIFEKLYSNDIYGNYKCFLPAEYNGVNVNLIHPATSKHIEKFKRKEFHIVDETYELYQKITLPYIETNSFSIQWIYNILNHKAEQDKIVYEDNNEKDGFIMINDLKWDGEPNTLKLLALPFQKIKSIRDLNSSHIPLLKNIRDAGIKTITKKFNIPASQLRIYLHYQPSYYYLHVHFAYLMFEAQGIFVEKAHLLSTVIRNIELMPDYYTKAVLSYAVAEGDPLYTKFREEGVLVQKASTIAP